MKRPFIVIAALACLSGQSWGQNEPFIAEIRTYAFDFCPRGETPLNGQLLSISQNTALFSLIGTRYGGDGRVNFALPTAKPIYTATRAPLLQCIALQGIYPSRN